MDASDCGQSKMGSQDNLIFLRLFFTSSRTGRKLLVLIEHNEDQRIHVRCVDGWMDGSNGWID